MCPYANDPATGSAHTSATDAPPDGWAVPQAPNGRLLPLDFSRVPEAMLVRRGGRAAIYALGRAAADYDARRPAILFVHGLQGSAAKFASIAAGIDADRFQLHVLCFDDSHRHTARNGDELADELRALAARSSSSPRLLIIAHSMGGIVARRALVNLALSSSGGLNRFSAVDLIAIDTPWHGFAGPSDQGAGSVMMAIARPFIPDGYEDMRAASSLFAGDPGSANPVERAGLYHQLISDKVTVRLVFATVRNEVLDYTQAPLSALQGLLADHFAREAPIHGEPRIMNFYRALLDSAAWFSFSNDLRDRDDPRTLDAVAVLDALKRHYPRFPGDHDSVLDAAELHQYLHSLLSKIS